VEWISWKGSFVIRNLSSLPAHRTLDVLNEAIRLDHEERGIVVATRAMEIVEARIVLTFEIERR